MYTQYTSKAHPILFTEAHPLGFPALALATISLGVPIGWDFSEEEFWWTKYRKCKSYIAHWHDVERMSPYGKSLLANACVYGRFRYWAMHTSSE